MQAYDFPTLCIGYGDLSVLRNVIRGYLAYARRTTKATPCHSLFTFHEQAHLFCHDVTDSFSACQVSIIRMRSNCISGQYKSRR